MARREDDFTLSSSSLTRRHMDGLQLPCHAGLLTDALPVQINEAPSCHGHDRHSLGGASMREERHPSRGPRLARAARRTDPGLPSDGAASLLFLLVRREGLLITDTLIDICLEKKTPIIVVRKKHVQAKLCTERPFPAGLSHGTPKASASPPLPPHAQVVAPQCQ